MTVPDYLGWHIRPFFTDAKVRNAVWQIWFNRDYTAWGALKKSYAYSLTNWGTAERMTFYIRKDIDSQLWPYGASPQPAAPRIDPYEGLSAPVTPDASLGSAGNGAGQFQAPRQIALAADAACTWPIRSMTASSTCARTEPSCKPGAREPIFHRALPRVAPSTNPGGGGCAGWQRVCGGYLELPHPEIHA
jgi:hypothetical protein